MEKAHKKMIKNVDFNERICIFYMTGDMLVKFLKDDSKPPEGILQKVKNTLNSLVYRTLW